ncbi:hypothetical protein CRG98_041840 [Punica granatum]|uniref:RimM N-terminal domain-containing protein n=1 Tax=Punica granatum TaxID=22663 RepID=A0A2I0I1A7_PUNGR|nr:hypothetical protein CRG98_041840 [Punica granatum]
MVQEIELVDGRGHPGQKTWILKFEGIDTVDQAKQLIGSTLLVAKRDRPELDEGEFYTHDLVGMRVIHKETAEVVGTVVSVYDSGANDLLHVQLDSSARTLDGSGKSKEEENGAPDRLIWVPFVEAIVPDIDVQRKEMFITPPKGLLELNLRSDTISKKERRQLEWKERKRFQKRLIAAKKKLCELEQQHVFHGFRYGEKAQGRLLADQIVGINSKLLQQALQNIQMSSEINNVAKFLGGTKSKVPATTVEKLSANSSFHENGNRLIFEGKLAILLVVNDSDRLDISNSDSFPEFLVQVEDRGSVPMILISPSHQITPLERLFLENDYFAFDSKKVWFLEEEMLPVVSISTEEPKKHKILMKSPWEMLQSPVGPGGIVCSTDRVLQGAPELLLGFTKSKEAEVGIQVSEDTKQPEQSVDMILSLSFLNKLVNQIDKLQYFAIPKASSHVEFIEKQWVDVVPSSPNSYEIRGSLYSCLNFCSSDKDCRHGDGFEKSIFMAQSNGPSTISVSLYSRGGKVKSGLRKDFVGSIIFPMFILMISGVYPMRNLGIFFSSANKNTKNLSSKGENSTLWQLQQLTLP